MSQGRTVWGVGSRMGSRQTVGADSSFLRVSFRRTQSEIDECKARNMAASACCECGAAAIYTGPCMIAGHFSRVGYCRKHKHLIKARV